MNTNVKIHRRRFLQLATMIGTAAIVPVLGLQKAWGQASASSSPNIATSTALPSLITIRGSLYGKSKRIKLSPGVTSDLIILEGNGTYRLMVQPSYIHKSGRQVYTVNLIDPKTEDVLDSMNAIGNMSVTFEKFGVQVYLGPSPGGEKL